MGDQIGAIRFFEEHQADLCVLAELTDLDIYLGHRGQLYWDITAYGRAAHTCRRHEAVNSIARMAPLIEEVEALHLTPEVSEEVVDLVGPELYTAVGRIHGGLPPGGPSMIPDEITSGSTRGPTRGLGEEAVRSADQGVVGALGWILAGIEAEVVSVCGNPVALPGEDPPAAVAAAMARADVVFEVTLNFAGSSRARREAYKQGTRYITVPGLSWATLRRGGPFDADFAVLGEHGRMLAEKIDTASEFHLTSPAGPTYGAPSPVVAVGPSGA